MIKITHLLILLQLTSMVFYIYYKYHLIKLNFQLYPKTFITLLLTYITGISLLLYHVAEISHFLRQENHYKIFMMIMASFGAILGLLAGYYDSDWLFITYRASPLVELLGRKKARIFYMLLGILLGLTVFIELYATYTGWQYPYISLIWRCKNVNSK